MLATQFVRLPNGKILREVRLGSGRPVLLLHGYPDNLQIWCRLAPLLAQRFQVIAIDWPGMGYSESWPGGATPEHMADRIKSLLDYMEIDCADLIAADMGGQPALVFSAKYPTRVSRLVVLNSLVFGDEKTSWEIRLLRNFGWNRILLGRFPRIVFRRALSTFLPRQFPLPDDLRADFWNAFREKQVRAFIAKMCAGYQGTLHELPAWYGKIQCPTRILWAGCGGHFPTVHAERLHAAIPDSQLQIIPGAHHWMHWYLAEEVAACIESTTGPVTA